MPDLPTGPQWMGEWCIIEALAEKHTTLLKETRGVCNTTAFRGKKNLFRLPKGFQFGFQEVILLGLWWTGFFFNVFLV